MLFARGAVLFGVLVLLTLSRAAGAESVAVNREQGQGFLVSHRNNCYLILPNHIVGRSLNLTLSAGAPPVTGEARVFHRFPDMDLALAHVPGDFHGRCQTRFDRLQEPSDALLSGRGTLSLVRVEGSGLVTREPVLLREILYETLTLQRPETTRAFGQGTSGSFLFADAVPVAMMYEASGTNIAYALRMDAIAARIGRLLEGGVTAGDLPPSPDPQRKRGESGIAFQVGSCSPEPFDPDHACSRLVTGGALLMPPGTPVKLVLDLDLPEDRARAIRSVLLITEPDGGARYTVPRSLRIEVDSSSGTNSRWRRFAEGDMSPFGLFESTSGVGQLARRVRITIQNGWKDSLPLRIDRIEVR